MRRRRQKRKRRAGSRAGRTVCIILIVLLAAAALFCAWQIVRILRVDLQARDTYSSLSDLYTGTLPDNDTEETQEDMAGETEPAFRRIVNFDALAEVNPDIVGWLVCEDTVIDYPVVQGADNDYYLNHLFDGTVSSIGSLFMEASNAADFTDDNTIIYGHHMKNGQMFRSLDYYEDQDYYEEHPTMMLYTPEGDYQVQIFASSIVDGADGLPLNFSGEEDKTEWINKMRSESDISCDVAVTAEDRILTLYTCAYTFDSARRIVVGKLVPGG